MTESSEVTREFERALGEILARVCVCASQTARPALAVAYSGGLDSSVLLHLAWQYAQRAGLPLVAFHVHHGLSANADAWEAHCRTACATLGVAFDVRRVQLIDVARHGIEQAARRLRYAALGQMCAMHRIDLLLSAHHLDDQAETVLLQLLRGAGPAGLSGMAQCDRAENLLGHAEVRIARPLLDVGRSALEDYAIRAGITHIDDESNRDVRYARNALRQRVMPVLDEFFPGFQERLARSASHMQSAQRLLDDLAAQDWQHCGTGQALDLTLLAQLNDDRADNLLRYWLRLRGARMPSTAWLRQLRQQVAIARADADVRIDHPDCSIRRFRDRLYALPSSLPPPLSAGVTAQFFWRGEEYLAFPAFGGRLWFRQVAGQGIDPAWLREQNLQLTGRLGGESLKLAENRPARSLKQHYQALDVPSWERQRLPLLRADGHLLFAAGIGIDCRVARFTDQGIVLHWEPADKSSDEPRAK